MQETDDEWFVVTERRPEATFNIAAFPNAGGGLRIFCATCPSDAGLAVDGYFEPARTSGQVRRAVAH